MKKLTLFLFFLFVVSCTKDPIIYTLTTSANPADGGTVSPSTQQYEEGKTATITATASSEYSFQSWSGATGSTNSTSVVMNSDKSVTANFVKKKYELTIEVEGEGTVSQKVIKAGLSTDYTSGTVIELTATPSDSNWIFSGFTGAFISNENPIQVTMNSDIKIIAKFIKIQFPLIINIEGVGQVNQEVIKEGSTPTNYTVGTVLKLSAVAKESFINWKGDLEGIESVKEIKMDGPKTVTAIFRNAFYFDENGITIKCPSAEIGYTDQFNGKNYEVVDYESLREKIKNGDDLTCVCTSQVENMSSLGFGSSFNQDISSWDTSNVIEMKWMFREAAAFNQDIGSWDTSNVKSMEGMFAKSNFNQDIGNWNTGNVENFRAMFWENLVFNQDIGNWNTSKSKNMAVMFHGKSLNHSEFNQDIGNWDTSNVTDMNRMFSLNKFNQDISRWDTSKVVSMHRMFNGDSYGGQLTYDGRHKRHPFNQDIGIWDVSSVTTMWEMFAVSEFNQDIGSWDISSVTNMGGMFQYGKFNQDISNWDVSNVQKIGYMFYVNQFFDQDIGKWDTGSVNALGAMFNYSVFNQDISKWCLGGLDASFNITKENFAQGGKLTELHMPIAGKCLSGFSVKTSSGVDTEFDSATLSGSIVSDDPNIKITERGFIWSKQRDLDSELFTFSEESNEKGTFSYKAESLDPDMYYYFKAWAKDNNNKIKNGKIISFRTKTPIPVISTKEITSISKTGAVSGGKDINDNGYDIQQKGVVWSTSTNPTVSLSTKTNDGTGTSSYNSSITDLNPNTTYYVRSYASNKYGTAYGNNIGFKTDSDDDGGGGGGGGSGPVTTKSISSINSTSAKSGGSISSDGGYAITSKGVVWSTSTNPTVSLSTKTNDGTGTSTYNSSITDLNPNTTYYVKAYATNSQGTKYGGELNFTTKKSPSPVSDIDGNSYTMIEIGNQIWSKSNLNVSKYRNGDDIPLVTDADEWASLTTGAYCYIYNNSSYGNTYGKLYNWYAINDSRGLIPSGYNVPKDSEWSTLVNHLGGFSIAGAKMKEKGSGGTNWGGNNSNATNSSNFSAKPGGYRSSTNGAFYSFGPDGVWWSSTQIDNSNAYYFLINQNSDGVTRNTNKKTNGFSIRFIKD